MKPIVNFEDIAQRRSEPLGKYMCKLLWPDGDGFCVVMNELPEEFCLDSLGDRFWFTQSSGDKQVYLYRHKESLNEKE